MHLARRIFRGMQEAQKRLGPGFAHGKLDLGKLNRGLQTTVEKGIQAVICTSQLGYAYVSLPHDNQREHRQGQEDGAAHLQVGQHLPKLPEQACLDNLTIPYRQATGLAVPEQGIGRICRLDILPASLATH
ncbi:hypothetical protein ETQ85_22515 [Zoogloea oleivorans]|uniref:Uncharacterized protein n=1 Tax=Zoogloea oleivorans TaxID=1552750 RepID=A0A6C2CHF1_9RHOO|nr:hypothetical protein ETQ85_22515 [Zoogloea oleivorans]